MWRTSGQWTFSTVVRIAQEFKGCHLCLSIIEMQSILPPLSEHCTYIEAVAISGIGKKEQSPLQQTCRTTAFKCVCLPQKKVSLPRCRMSLRTCRRQEGQDEQNGGRRVRFCSLTHPTFPAFTSPWALQIPTSDWGFCIRAQGDSSLQLACGISWCRQAETA